MGILDYLSSRATLLANTATDGCSIGSLVGGDTAIQFAASKKITIARAVTAVAGAASATITATDAIPAGGVFLLGVIVEVTATFSNTSLTAFTVGDGSTADLFGTAVALTLGTRTTYAGHKSTWTPVFKAAKGNVVLTGTGANFAANGSANVEVYYLTLA